jgi:hypothetical protein
MTLDLVLFLPRPPNRVQNGTISLRAVRHDKVQI